MPTFAFLLTVLLAAPDSTSGPTLAVEDTMRTEVSEVLVRAPRVTLDEILDRVARGEEKRDELLKDVVFTATLRVVRAAQGKDTARIVQESVSRVYRQKPDRVRSVTLRSWQEKPSKLGKADVTFGPGTAEEVVNFAFKPEARRDFTYRIVGRELLGNHLIYRIAFEPRSLVGGTEPAGVVWVDTKDFVIVREELDFPQSPVPLFIKDLRHVVVERHLADGYWMLHRMLMRAETTIRWPSVGRIVDMVVTLDDYRINRGIDPAVFVKEKP